MHEYMPFFLFVVGAAGIILALLAILALYQIWKAAKGITTLMEIVNRDLPGILQNVQSMTTTLDETACALQTDIAIFSKSLERINGIGNAVSVVHQLALARMRQPVFKTIKTIVSLVRGLQAFTSVYRGKSLPRV